MTNESYTSEFRERGGSHQSWETNIAADKAKQDAEDAELDIRQKAEEKRRMELFKETGRPYDPLDYVRSAINDADSLTRKGGGSRDKTMKKEAGKRIAESFKDGKANGKTVIDEGFDEIVANVEEAYKLDQMNNTKANVKELDRITEQHTKRILAREIQEGTALDEIRRQKTKRG